MASNHWIQGAVGHPGVVKAAAKREGMTVHAWAEKHKGDPEPWGGRARLALRFEAMGRKRKLASAAGA